MICPPFGFQAWTTKGQSKDHFSLRAVLHFASWYNLKSLIPPIIVDHACITNLRDRVWKGFYVIRDLAEIELVIREYIENPAVIREFCISCDAGFSLSVVRDS